MPTDVTAAQRTESVYITDSSGNTVSVTSNRLVVDGSGVTQPVSGTVSITANSSVNLAQVGGTNVVTGGVAGSQGVGGLAAAGSAIAGNPVLMGGTDGANARALKTNSAGVMNVMGSVAAGSAASGNPLLTGLVDPSGNIQVVKGSAAQAVFVAGSTATGSALADNPILIGGSDGTNVRSLSVDATGKLNVNASAAAASDTTASGAVGSLNANVAVAMAGQQTASFVLPTGNNLVATLTFQCSIDGGTTYATTGVQYRTVSSALGGWNPGSTTIAASSTVESYEVICPGGSSHIRVIATAYTSGTATVAARSTANIDGQTLLGVADVIGPLLNVSGTSNTSGSAVALAGHTTIGAFITTTNYTGTLSFQYSNDGGANYSAASGLWFRLQVDNAWVLSLAYAASTSTAQRFAVSVPAGTTHVRALFNAMGSNAGTATAQLRATNVSDYQGQTAFGASGVAVPPTALQIGGSDGSILRPVSVDSSGRVNSLTPDISASASSVSTVTQVAALALQGHSSVSAIITTAAFSGTYGFQWSNDNGTTWSGGNSIWFRSGNVNNSFFQQSQTVTTDTSTTRVIVAVPGGATNVRLNVSAATAGSLSVTLTATEWPEPSFFTAVGGPGIPFPPGLMQVGGSDGTNLQPIPLNTGGASVVVQGYQPAATTFGSVTTTGAKASTSVAGLNVATITLRTFTGTTPSITWKLQASDDNTNWVDIQGINNSTGQVSISWTQASALTAGTAGPSVDYSIGAYSNIRINVTAISGATATAAFGMGLQSMPYEPSPGALCQGMAADGTAVVGNPVLIGGMDGSGNAQTMSTDTSGNVNVSGIQDLAVQTTAVSTATSTAWYSLAGHTGICFQLANVGATCTVQFEGTIDGGTTVFTLYARKGGSNPAISAAVSFTTDSTTPRYNIFPQGGTLQVRAHFTAFTAGSTTVKVVATNAIDKAMFTAVFGPGAGSGLPTDAVMIAGSDGTDGRYLSTDTSGRPIVSLVDGQRATYRCAVVAFTPIASASAPTFSITGSASKTVRILRIRVSASASTGGIADLSVKRYSALSGGTAASQAANIAKMDSTNAAATAVVNTWSVAATTATAAGIVVAERFELVTPAVTVQPQYVEWTFGNGPGQGLVLRGTGEFVGLLFSAIGTTPLADAWVEFTEE